MEGDGGCFGSCGIEGAWELLWIEVCGGLPEGAQGDGGARRQKIGQRNALRHQKPMRVSVAIVGKLL